MDETEDEDVPEEEEPASEAVNAADPASVKRASKRAKIWAAQRRQFWAGALSTEIGRRCIWEFLRDECNYNSELPIANSPSGMPDPLASMAWMGVKNVGLRLYDMLLRVDHDRVFEMRRENDSTFSEARRRR